MVTPQTESERDSLPRAQDAPNDTVSDGPRDAGPRDAYTMLQVRSTASRTLIEQAYWRLAEDAQRRSGPSAPAYLAALNAAYSTLIDSARREAYDAAYGFTPSSPLGASPARKQSGIARLFARTVAAVAPPEPSPYEMLHVADDASQDIIDLAFVVQRLGLKDAKLDDTDSMRDLERAYSRIATGEMRAAFDAGAPAPAPVAPESAPAAADAVAEGVDSAESPERPHARITFLRPRRRPIVVPGEELGVMVAANGPEAGPDSTPSEETPAAVAQAPADAHPLPVAEEVPAAADDSPPVPAFMREPEPFPASEPELVPEPLARQEMAAASEASPAVLEDPDPEPEPVPPVIVLERDPAPPAPPARAPVVEAPVVGAASVTAAAVVGSQRRGLLGRLRGGRETSEERAKTLAAEDDRLLSLREVLASVPPPSSAATILAEPEADAPALPASAYLSFTGGVRAGTRLPLYGDAVTLGTSLAAGIILPDDTGRVARDHARIWRQGDAYFFRQVEGFGTTIGGRDLDMPVVVLEDGDEIAIGTHTLRFTLG